MNFYGNLGHGSSVCFVYNSMMFFLGAIITKCWQTSAQGLISALKIKDVSTICAPQ